MNVWKAAGATPDGEKDEWYTVFSLGKLGNGPTTDFANRRNAYAIMDRATCPAKQKGLKIVPLVEGGPILLNLIAAMEVAPKRFPQVNNADEAQTIIKDFKVERYAPAALLPELRRMEQETRQIVL